MSKKTSFLKKRKNINDKFFDLVNLHTKKVPVKRKGKEKWVLKGVTKLAKELKISPSTLKIYINKGAISDTGGYLPTKVFNLHKKNKIKGSKIETKEFTVHNFTKNNFFKKKNFKKAKKNEQFYYRCGLYLHFERKNKRGKITMQYVIQNFPIAHYSSNYNKGYNEFFEIIQIELQSHPSLKFFRFNYFDVQKIDISK